jgi:cell division protein FtsQ
VVDWNVKTIGRISAVALAFLVVSTAPIWLRTVSFFDVRQVEVLGARYLDAGTIVSSLHLREGHNLYESLTALENNVSGVAGVELVEIERRLPATLLVTIVERTPVAFVPGLDGMIALDAQARPLPYDPAAVRLDLPVVATTDAALTGTIALVRGLDANMFAEVVGARISDEDNIVLEFPGQSVIFESTPSIGDILKITVVRQHLRETDAAYDQLDARFDGLVVARRPEA